MLPLPPSIAEGKTICFEEKEKTDVCFEEKKKRGCMCQMKKRMYVHSFFSCLEDRKREYCLDLNSRSLVAEAVGREDRVRHDLRTFLLSWLGYLVALSQLVKTWSRVSKFK